MRMAKRNFTIYAKDDAGYTYLHHIECRRPKSTKAWGYVWRMLNSDDTTTNEIGYFPTTS